MARIIQDILLGKNIRKIRKSKKMTQRETSEQMQLMGSSMSRGTLGNIESGIRNIKASDLKRLKEIFDVSFDEFFEE